MMNERFIHNDSRLLQGAVGGGGGGGRASFSLTAEIDLLFQERMPTVSDFIRLYEARNTKTTREIRVHRL